MPLRNKRIVAKRQVTFQEIKVTPEEKKTALHNFRHKLESKVAQAEFSERNGIFLLSLSHNIPLCYPKALSLEEPGDLQEYDECNVAEIRKLVLRSSNRSALMLAQNTVWIQAITLISKVSSMNISAVFATNLWQP